MRTARTPGLHVSQADGAGSIPVTGSPTKAQVRERFPLPGPVVVWACMTLRAPRVPLARRDQDARSTLIGVVVLHSRALGVLVEESFQRIRDLAVRLLRRVLVDQGPHTVVTHPDHEVSKRRTAAGGEQVDGVPQIVEVQAWRAHGSDALRPAQAWSRRQAPKGCQSRG